MERIGEGFYGLGKRGMKDVERNIRRYYEYGVLEYLFIGVKSL